MSNTDLIENGTSIDNDEIKHIHNINNSTELKEIETNFNNHDIIDNNTNNSTEFNEVETKIDDNDNININSSRAQGRKDKFGFWTAENSFHRSLLVSDAENKRRKEKDTERAKKWEKMMKDWTRTTNFRSAKLKSRVRKGIPDSMRIFAWPHLAGTENFKTKFRTLKAITDLQLPDDVIDAIERDVDRTFPNHDFFSDKNSVGQASLRRVLQWYAFVDTEVGYCQGMGFMVGMLLTYLPEDEAFCCFYSVMKSSQYFLRELYLPNMIGAQRVLYVFNELAIKHLSKLYTHLLNEGIHQSMYVTEWIMTMYCRGFSFDLATRVWEIFLSEGFKIIYRVALALLKNIESELLSMSFENILHTLREISSTVDAPQLIVLACSIPLKRKEIESLDRQFDEEFKQGGGKVVL